MTQWAAINAVAETMGVGTVETVPKYVRQAEVHASPRPGSEHVEHLAVEPGCAFEYSTRCPHRKHRTWIRPDGPIHTS
jgi:hypothetical protein